MLHVGTTTRGGGPVPGLGRQYFASDLPAFPGARATLAPAALNGAGWECLKPPSPLTHPARQPGPRAGVFFYAVHLRIGPVTQQQTQKANEDHEIEREQRPTQDGVTVLGNEVQDPKSGYRNEGNRGCF